MKTIEIAKGGIFELIKESFGFSRNFIPNHKVGINSKDSYSAKCDKIMDYFDSSDISIVKWNPSK